MASLLPHPSQTAVDTKGGSLSTAWMRWFQTLQTGVSGLLGSFGSQYVNNAYGSFQSTATQTVGGINTATIVSLNTSGAVNGVTLAANKITASIAGAYEVQYTAQFSNTGAAAQEAYIWLRKNGVDVAGTTSVVSVQPLHSAVSGFATQSMGFVIVLSAGDYIEFYWSTNAVSVQLLAAVAGSTPVMPATPSFSVTSMMVSS